MRNFILLFFTFWIVSLFLPWWTLFIPAIVLGAVFFERSFQAFLIGFFSLFAAWAIQVIYIDIANESILSGRIAEMIGVNQGWIVILITSFIGGLIGGMGTMLGSQFRQLVRPEKAHTSQTL